MHTPISSALIWFCCSPGCVCELWCWFTGCPHALSLTHSGGAAGVRGRTCKARLSKAELVFVLGLQAARAAFGLPPGSLSRAIGSTAGGVAGGQMGAEWGARAGTFAAEALDATGDEARIVGGAGAVGGAAVGVPVGAASGVVVAAGGVLVPAEQVMGAAANMCA